MDDLLALDDDNFREVVDRDLRRETSMEVAAALRSPELVDRWLAVLTSMMKNVENTLAFRAQDFDANKAALRRRMSRARNQREVETLKDELEKTKEAHARSRAKTLRFKAGLEEHLIEARYQWDRAHPDLVLVRVERDAFEERVNVLERALKAHRRQAIADHDLHALVG